MRRGRGGKRYKIAEKTCLEIDDLLGFGSSSSSLRDDIYLQTDTIASNLLPKLSSSLLKDVSAVKRWSEARGFWEALNQIKESFQYFNLNNDLILMVMIVLM